MVYKRQRGNFDLVPLCANLLNGSINQSLCNLKSDLIVDQSSATDRIVPEVVDVEHDAERVADDEHHDHAEQDRSQL